MPSPYSTRHSKRPETGGGGGSMPSPGEGGDDQRPPDSPSRNAPAPSEPAADDARGQSESGAADAHDGDAEMTGTAETAHEDEGEGGRDASQSMSPVDGPTASPNGFSSVNPDVSRVQQQQQEGDQILSSPQSSPASAADKKRRVRLTRSEYETLLLTCLTFAHLLPFKPKGEFYRTVVQREFHKTTGRLFTNCQQKVEGLMREREQLKRGPLPTFSRVEGRLGALLDDWVEISNVTYLNRSTQTAQDKERIVDQIRAIQSRYPDSIPGVPKPRGGRTSLGKTKRLSNVHQTPPAASTAAAAQEELPSLGASSPQPVRTPSRPSAPPPPPAAVVAPPPPAPAPAPAPAPIPAHSGPSPATHQPIASHPAPHAVAPAPPPPPPQLPPPPQQQQQQPLPTPYQPNPFHATPPRSAAPTTTAPPPPLPHQQQIPPPFFPPPPPPPQVPHAASPFAQQQPPPGPPVQILLPPDVQAAFVSMCRAIEAESAQRARVLGAEMRALKAKLEVLIGSEEGL